MGKECKHGSVVVLFTIFSGCFVFFSCCFSISFCSSRLNLSHQTQSLGIASKLSFATCSQNEVYANTQIFQASDCQNIRSSSSKFRGLMQKLTGVKRGSLCAHIKERLKVVQLCSFTAARRSYLLGEVQLVVAVASILPVKGGLLLPQKMADQKRIGSRGFFLSLHCGSIVLLSILLFSEERMGESPSH